MPMLAGSPCYPPWRFLTSLWRDYTNTWRSFSSPLTIPPVGMSTSELAAVYELGEVTVGAVAAAGSPSGGWLALLGAGPTTPALEAASAGQIDAAAASAAQAGTLAAGSANVSSGASAANDSVLVVVSGAGGLLRTVSLPPARLSTGRLTWRS